MASRVLRRSKLREVAKQSRVHTWREISRERIGRSIATIEAVIAIDSMLRMKRRKRSMCLIAITKALVVVVVHTTTARQLKIKKKKFFGHLKDHQINQRLLPLLKCRVVVRQEVTEAMLQQTIRIADMENRQASRGPLISMVASCFDLTVELSQTMPFNFSVMNYSPC